MNLTEIERALRKLRLSGMAQHLDVRILEAQTKLLGDTAAASALLDRLLHHAHVLQCGPKSWRMQRKGRDGLQAATSG